MILKCRSFLFSKNEIYFRKEGCFKKKFLYIWNLCILKVEGCQFWQKGSIKSALKWLLNVLTESCVSLSESHFNTQNSLVQNMRIGLIKVNDFLQKLVQFSWYEIKAWYKISQLFFWFLLSHSCASETIMIFF